MLSFNKRNVRRGCAKETAGWGQKETDGQTDKRSDAVTDIGNTFPTDIEKSERDGECKRERERERESTHTCKGNAADWRKNQMLSDRRRKGRLEKGVWIEREGNFSAGHRVGECTHCIKPAQGRQLSQICGYTSKKQVRTPDVECRDYQIPGTQIIKFLMDRDISHLVLLSKGNYCGNILIVFRSVRVHFRLVFCVCVRG